MAFILNHQQHWFALRRFGNLNDLDNGHWFNLNSFLPAPEWVSKLYLGMVLSQAENEGLIPRDTSTSSINVVKLLAQVILFLLYDHSTKDPELYCHIQKQMKLL